MEKEKDINQIFGSLNGDENDTKVIRVREELNRYSMEDKRIKVVYLEENQARHSRNT